MSEFDLTMFLWDTFNLEIEQAKIEKILDGEYQIFKVYDYEGPVYFLCRQSSGCISWMA